MNRKLLLISLGLLLGIFETLLGWIILPRNFLGGFLIFTGLGYCIGGGFFLALSSREEIPRADRSLLALLPAGLLVLLAMPLEYIFLPEILPRAQIAQWLGLIILCAAMFLRLWARSALKQAYQGNLQVQPGQRVVTSGPYRRVRHPGYLAFALLALGLAVGFSSLAGLLGTALLVMGLRYRLQVEERMLEESFGEEYVEYAHHTRKMIPGVW